MDSLGNEKETEQYKTIKDICEFIADSKILVRKDGTNPTALEIFNYSPTGELFKIFEWYEVAKSVARQ